MSVQFLSNDQGKIVAVQVPLKEWMEMSRKMEAYDVAQSIKQGLAEVDMIEKGQLQAKTIDDLLNEL